MNSAPTWREGARRGAVATARRQRDTSWYASGWVATVEGEQAGGDRWRCDGPPPDPKHDSSPGRRGWRSSSTAPLVQRDLEQHDARRRVVRVLRRSGYAARGWAVASGRYTEGPAVGLRAADPWRLAHDLDQCGARWAVGVHLGGGASAAPLRCNRGAVCPVCAARAARARAGAARAVLAPLLSGDAPHTAALVTFTQRSLEGETLQAAGARFRAGLRRLRLSDRWSATIDGAVIGYEVTRGRSGRCWHYHAHAVVLVRPGLTTQAARQSIGRGWVEASGWASARAGAPGYGWSPAAGGCRTSAGEVRSWAGPWWREMAGLDEVGQALKYPSPLASLADPTALAEFLAYSHGRRWSEGVGLLRGYASAAPADDAGSDEAAAAAASTAEQLGPRITAWGPTAPALDRIDPAYGWRTKGHRAFSGPLPRVVLVKLARRYREDAEAIAILDGLGVRCAAGWEVEPAVLRTMLAAAGESAEVGRTARRLPPRARRGLPPSPR